MSEKMIEFEWENHSVKVHNEKAFIIIPLSKIVDALGKEGYVVKETAPEKQINKGLVFGVLKDAISDIKVAIERIEYLTKEVRK